jgi:hypothetical protein
MVWWLDKAQMVEPVEEQILSDRHSGADKMRGNGRRKWVQVELSDSEGGRARTSLHKMAVETRPLLMGLSAR